MKKKKCKVIHELTENQQLCAFRSVAMSQNIPSGQIKSHNDDSHLFWFVDLSVPGSLQAYG
jgi:hypothetical protein